MPGPGACLLSLQYAELALQGSIAFLLREATALLEGQKHSAGSLPPSEGLARIQFDPVVPVVKGQARYDCFQALQRYANE